MAAATTKWSLALILGLAATGAIGCAADAESAVESDTSDLSSAALTKKALAAVVGDYQSDNRSPTEVLQYGVGSIHDVRSLKLYANGTFETILWTLDADAGSPTGVKLVETESRGTFRVKGYQVDGIVDPSISIWLTHESPFPQDEQGFGPANNGYGFGSFAGRGNGGDHECLIQLSPHPVLTCYTYIPRRNRYDIKKQDLVRAGARWP